MPELSRDYTFTPLSGERIESKRGRGRATVPMGLIIDNTCRVYITQIPLERIERDGANALREEFEAFGPVESYKMFTDKSGRFIGSVLCTYRNPADASTAVQNMNGQTIESSILKVSLSRDHGVVLLHQAGSKGRRGFDDDDGEGKWQHDQYQAAPDSDNNNYNYNYYNNKWESGYGSQRGGGRGRGRRGGRHDSIEDAFERYILSRDNEGAESETGLQTNNNNNNNNNMGVSEDVFGSGEKQREEEEGGEEAHSASGVENNNNNNNQEEKKDENITSGMAPVPLGGMHEDEQK